MLTVERYARTRFWALYENRQLLCVTVYKKGANAVRDRIERGEPIAQAPPPAASVPDIAACRSRRARASPGGAAALRRR